MRFDPSSSCRPAPSTVGIPSLDFGRLPFVAPDHPPFVSILPMIEVSEHLLHNSLSFNVLLSKWLKFSSCLLVLWTALPFDSIPFLLIDFMGLLVVSGSLVVSILVVKHVVLGCTSLLASARAFTLRHPLLAVLSCPHSVARLLSNSLLR